MTDVSDTGIALRLIVKGAGVAFIGGFVGKGIAYITRIIMARYLGPGEYGLFSLVLSIFSVISIFVAVGIPGGVIRYVSEFRDNREKVLSIVKTSLIITFFISVSVSILTFIFSDFLFLNIFGNIRGSFLLKSMIPFFILLAVTSIFTSIMIAYKRIEYRVYSEDIGKNIVRLAIMLFLFYLGYDIVSAFAGYVAGIIISFIISIYFVHKKLIKLSGRWSFDSVIASNLLSYSWPLIFSSFFIAIMGHIDILMIGYFLETTDIGLYNAALMTAQIVILFSAPFVAIFLPTITDLYSKGKKNETVAVYKTVTKWLFFVISPISVAIMLFSDEIIGILFGSAYSGASMPLFFLSIGYFITSILHASHDIINLHKKTKIHLYAAITTMIIAIFLNLFMIPRYGILGASVATSLSLIWLASFVLYFSYRLSGINPFNIGFLKPIFCSLISFSIIRFIGNYVFTSISFVAVLVSILLSFSLYIIILKSINFFSREDYDVYDSIRDRVLKEYNKRKL